MRHRLARIRRPVKRYAGKFTGDGSAPPPHPGWPTIAVAWLGALAALAGLGALAELNHAPLVMAPFGASVVLLFGHPDSPLSQPRNVIGGHLVGGVVGLLAGLVPLPGWLALAIAVATAIALMKALRCVHPPAGATAIVCLHLGWQALLAPVLAGAALLVVAAALYNNAIEHRRYPRQWW